MFLALLFGGRRWLLLLLLLLRLLLPVCNALLLQLCFCSSAVQDR